MTDFEMQESIDGIAIVGMAGRFPGAKNVKEFWANLCGGVESIRFFTDEELLAKNINPALLADPNYVKSGGGLLENIDLFDASFFGYNPREAEILNPQHRFFLECAWEALENAGYDPERYDGRIGVYAGEGLNSYLLNIYSNRDLTEKMSGQQIAISNDKDFLATQVSYKLNLKGPSVSVQTACSTSLVAVALACQGLLDYKCDMVLAGGVTITTEQQNGYLYQEGGIDSPDGHCRPFDAKAQGTVGGNGVGIVVLKRLEDALSDGDHIYAVIKGSAINNDGSLKVGYTAPSVDGQAEAIAEAIALAEIEPETIGYIETHGTATTLGDPIEIAALSEVFNDATAKNCAIGSVKSNIGHLDTAAGVAGLIKTALTLKQKLIPPTLHYKQPNPKIDFANSPFYVNTTLKEWKAGDSPRRAGVSSFGIGGTNAHVVLEEAPEIESEAANREWKLLLLSAKTDTALDRATENLAAFLKECPDDNLADIAYTLQVGRKGFNHRRAVVCKNTQDAINALESRQPEALFTGYCETSDAEIVFMFPGQGSQYVNMGRELYETEAVFQEQVDACLAILKDKLGLDLREILYPSDDTKVEEATRQLTQTSITQPALFVIEYALAKLWMEWGIKPAAMIGHSIGEYVAACLAGVITLEDALELVVGRAKLMQSLPEGSMLAVPLAEAEVLPLLGDELSLAAVNGPSLCVVSGKTETLKLLQNQLAERTIETTLLHTSHAFHSLMMEPILDKFMKMFANVTLSVPTIPFVSNLTGTWITEGQATDPAYWAKHLRETVRYSHGVELLTKDSAGVMLEVGPGRTLSTLLKRQIGKNDNLTILSSMRHPNDKIDDTVFLLNTLGKLWLAGCNVDWSSYYAGEKRLRVPLPTYPFEGRRFWVDFQENAFSKPALGKKANIDDWFYMPSWKSAVLPVAGLVKEKLCCLILADASSIGSQVLSRLISEGHAIITVTRGKDYTQASDNAFIINPDIPDNYDNLINALAAAGKVPAKVVHLWGLSDSHQMQTSVNSFEACQKNGFYSLLFLVQALEKCNVTQQVEFEIITNGMQDVNGEGIFYPEKATVLGCCRVIMQEYRNLTCRIIDIVTPEKSSWQEERLAGFLVNEITASASDQVVAYRGNKRLVQTYESISLSENTVGSKLRKNGVYVITGGLGNIGLVMAEHLARTVQAKLVLLGRSSFPVRTEWDAWLVKHGPEDGVSRKIVKLKEIEALGSEILTLSANVANEQQMQEAVAYAISSFGQINGVIHAAGIVGEDTIRSVQDLAKEHCELHFGPKVYGVYVLERVLQGKKIDFCMLVSSISSVLGGLGFTAYAAANAFMDAYVSAHNRENPVPWFSIGWDGWDFESQFRENATSGIGNAEFLLTPEEGTKVLQRILANNMDDSLIVSTGNLQARIKQWFEPETSSEQAISGSHARPDLANNYVQPRNITEEKIAGIWQELLGIEQIGINDNFFELGGHSLLATQLISRIRAVLKANVSIQSFFEAPTVAEMAKIIDEKDKQENELASLLSEIENLSNEDLLKALEEAAASEEQ